MPVPPEMKRLLDHIDGANYRDASGRELRATEEYQRARSLLSGDAHGLAGPHAKEELTDRAATPGTGMLPEGSPNKGDVDPGTG